MSRTARAVRRFGHSDVFALLFALTFVAARLPFVLDLPYECPFRALTGLPCATCGMTHAFVHMAHGQLRAALAASPLGAALAGAAWLFALGDLTALALGVRLPLPGPRAQRWISLGLAMAFLANWAFLVIALRA